MNGVINVDDSITIYNTHPAHFCLGSSQRYDYCNSNDFRTLFNDTLMFTSNGGHSASEECETGSIPIILNRHLKFIVWNRLLNLMVICKYI